MARVNSEQDESDHNDDDAEEDAPATRMSPVYAMLLRIFGPADRPDNPLVGTQYDPGRAAREDQRRFRRRRNRSIRLHRRWDKLLRGHNPVPAWTEDTAADEDAAQDQTRRRHRAPG